MFVENLRLLCEADTVLVDGTFDACPSLYSQLFTIHVFKETRLLPLIYCLLPDKSAATYVSLFGILQTEAVKSNLFFQPQRFISDFESGIIRAVAASFPNAAHQGCYFHFTQAVWRQVQSLGLAAHYRNDAAVKASVRQLMALGFAPLPLIRTAFTQIEAQSPACLQPLFTYFRTQWLTAVPPRMWNVHRQDPMYRTNNHLEGWHNGFNNIICQHHPNIWRLLAAMLQEQALTDVNIQQIAAGQVSIQQTWIQKVNVV